MCGTTPVSIGYLLQKRGGKGPKYGVKPQRIFSQQLICRRQKRVLCFNAFNFQRSERFSGTPDILNSPRTCFHDGGLVWPFAEASPLRRPGRVWKRGKPEPAKVPELAKDHHGRQNYFSFGRVPLCRNRRRQSAALRFRVGHLVAAHAPGWF